ncbi:hypothetical protein ABPG74_010023 [Tetrahymena malaccensis]
MFKPKQRKLQILQFQTQNKLFNNISKEKWEITKNQNQEADFIIEDSPYSFIFLSLKYHTQNNIKYIAQKLEAFKKNDDYNKFKKRIMLLLCDVNDDKDQMLYLHKMCDDYNLILLCGFTYQEIANYILTFISVSNNQQLPKQYLQNKKY